MRAAIVSPPSKRRLIWLRDASAYTSTTNKPAALVAAIEQAGMGAHVLIYASPTEAKQIHALQPGWKMMPEADNATQLGQLINALQLRVAAFDDSDFNSATLAVARHAGIDIYVDRLWAQD